MVTTACKPVFGTKEWASVNANCVRGCSHDCKYCYAKAMSIRFGRHTPATWLHEIPCPGKIFPITKMRPTRVMFPTTHDITECVLEECITAIRQLLSAGHELLLVSKPHRVCIERIITEFGRYRNKILFRFSIGSIDDGTLLFWEPGAPLFDERLGCLKLAFDKKFRTSVSCEPMLDGNIETVVKEVEPYVTDSVWIGKMNQLRARLSMNGYTDRKSLAKAETLISNQTDECINALYIRLKGHPLIRWKESIKKVVGLKIPSMSGQDV